MLILNCIPKKMCLLIIWLAALGFVGSCSDGKFWDPPDAGEISPNVQERVKKNLEEGKGFVLGDMVGGDATTYQFASSNPMWRATLEILDFLPLANIDYSGGIITTDWYNEGAASNESIKITVRFLTNEIRSDGLKIIVHKKRCSMSQQCTIKKVSSKLENELQVAILKKAAIYEKEYRKGKKKRTRKEVK